jgi:diguanylate cyclase (GGDEF)-like protein
VIDVQGVTGGESGSGQAPVDVLQRDVASLLAHSIRSNDVVVWLDGGQFLVIAPGANAKAAQTMGNRLLAKLRRHRFSAAGRGRVALTVTIGTASCAGGPVSEPFDLVERACEAVERGKVGGGNRVVSA